MASIAFLGTGTMGDAARDAFQRLLDEGFDELNESKVIDVLRS